MKLVKESILKPKFEEEIHLIKKQIEEFEEAVDEYK